MSVHRVLALSLSLMAAQSAGQQTLYQVPDLYLQATNAGQFRAHLPDKCGVEKFKFDWKAGGAGGPSPDWQSGPEINQPNGGYWTFENPAMGLGQGDLLDYRASVLYNGQPFSKPEAQWNVSDLVDVFTPPPPNPDECRNSSRAEQTTPAGLTPHRPSPAPPRLTEKEPTTPAADEGEGPGPCSRPWLLGPSPADSRITALEKQVVRLQCELGGFATLYKQMTKAVRDELTDLKKLNYAMVSRMQRLESLLKSVPTNSWP